MSDAIQFQSPRAKPSVGDMAYRVLKERREPMKYKDLVHEVLIQRGVLPGPDFSRLMAKTHTDLSLDNRFLNRGGGMCGLREWTVKPLAYKVVELSNAERLKPGERLRRELVTVDEGYQNEQPQEETLGEPEEPEEG